MPIDGGRVPDDATWLVVAPGSRVDRCGSWVRVAATDGWLVERRLAARGRCVAIGASG